MRIERGWITSEGRELIEKKRLLPEGRLRLLRERERLHRSATFSLRHDTTTIPLRNVY